MEACEVFNLCKHNSSKQSLGQAGLKLSATIELLRCTSVLIKHFRDKRPITNISDERIQQNHDSIHWFIKWENSENDRIDCIAVT
jgi:hypothetical protein